MKRAGEKSPAAFADAHVSFRSAKAFRAWLAKHHAVETELLVRLYRVHALARGMGYSEALDEALCFGWIDGVRRSLDADSFSVRFTPRKKGSIWSGVNIRRVAALQAAGRMATAGEAAFARREERKSRVYSFENEERVLDAAQVKRFRANARAWKHFQARPPWYRRTSIFWVVSAKRAETRERRLGELIERSERGEPIEALRRTGSRADGSFAES
jgi:uncharacterized protein YdeI (YjbR/CyaY-like superfamily)